MDDKQLKNILEAGLLVAGRTMSLAQLEGLFQHDTEKPERKQVREALESLKQDYEGRGIELVEVASGYRLQSHESVADWVANLFQEKAPRYSRALLETLVLIAYRQPITRAEIEDVRGVAVSSNIIKTLQERQWVKVLGHKDVPGKPALLGTSKEFLDYFNLKKLDDLPDLADIKDLDQFDELLAEEVGEVDGQGDAANDSGDVDTSQVDAAESDSDDADEAMLDLGAKEDEEATDESGSDQQVADGESSEDEIEVSDVDDNEDHSETLSGPERDLLKVISDFSEEHQQEIDARDQMEAGILSNKEVDSVDEIDEVELADLSQRVADETHNGELPEPGDTLH